MPLRSFPLKADRNESAIASVKIAPASSLREQSITSMEQVEWFPKTAKEPAEVSAGLKGKEVVNFPIKTILNPHEVGNLEGVAVEKLSISRPEGTALKLKPTLSHTSDMKSPVKNYRFFNSKLASPIRTKDQGASHRNLFGDDRLYNLPSPPSSQPLVQLVNGLGPKDRAMALQIDQRFSRLRPRRELAYAS